MRLTKSQLRKIILETLDESFMNPGGYGVSHPKQKKFKKPDRTHSEQELVASVIQDKFRSGIEWNQQKELTASLTQAIDKAIEGVLANFERQPLTEEAPPGKEDQVKALKKSFAEVKMIARKHFK